MSISHSASVSLWVLWPTKELGAVWIPCLGLHSPQANLAIIEGYLICKQKSVKLLAQYTGYISPAEIGSASAVRGTAAGVGSFMFRMAMSSSGVVETMIRARRRSILR